MTDDPVARLAVVTVVFHPPDGCLERQAAALPPEVLWVLVDNGTNDEAAARLQALASTRANTVVLRNEVNLGLAAALNRGAAHVSDTHPSRDLLLLLDQDTAPRPGSIGCLLQAFNGMEDASVGCVGPTLVDTTTGLPHGFHCIRGPFWTRRFPAFDATPIECANINGSGTLMRLDVFRRLGGLDETLFVDHVDTEWSFRLRAAGLSLFGVPAARFDHAMGERGIRFWLFGWRVWPQRSPARHFTLFRNAVALLGREYVPMVWKVWCVAKLSATLAAHAALDRRRGAQASSMLSGIRAGLRRNR
ncbi:MAG TPA: glycosyltransferase [Lysobacter sp.]|nr:glycosyltransferase [Lysobacter sp.]